MIEKIGILNKDHSLTSLSEYFVKITRIITSIVATSFFLSIDYNFGFFWALNIYLNDIPISTIDIINSTLLWTPIITVFFLYFMFVYLTTQRIIFPINKKNKRKVKNRKKMHLIIKILFYLDVYALCTMVLSYILYGVPEIDFYTRFTLAILSWGPISYWLVSHPKAKVKRHPIVKLLIHFVPILIISFCLIGYTSATIKLMSKYNDLLVYTKTESTPIDVTFLRALDRGLLVMVQSEKNKSILLISWDDIVKIRKNYYEYKFKGILNKS